jgi:DUF1680 family protein
MKGADVVYTPKSRFATAVIACAALAVGAAALQRPPARVVPDVAHPLPLTAVRLTGGPLKHAQDLDAAYLLALEPDRMLAYYRQRAGLEAKAQPYGGWDGDGRNLTGHIAGHHLSAVSLMYAATGDERFKQRAEYIVSELKVVQDKNGDGYLSALAGGRKAFGELSQGTIRSASFDLNGEWSPWYTLHKTFAGLRDAYRYTGNRSALDVELKFAQWAEGVLAPLSDAQLQQMLNTEFGGMNEVLADLYADTGDKRWVDLSHKFDHHAVIDPLVRGEDRLAGLHGNTQVPKVLGLAVRYGYTGDQADGAAARFFWDRVVNHHTFATGGHGKDEYFREPDHLSNIVDGRTAETCNVYNMLKLTRRLFALEPDVKYAEFEEQALFNHILGSIDETEGAMCYMVPVGRGVRREYQDMQRSFTCCVGSGMESHALHGDGIYYESGDRLWINLFAPTTVRWEKAGAQIVMETTFPEGDTASLKLTLASPKTLTIALRRPSWAGDGFTVKVNGAAVKDLPKPGSYVELPRTWKTGDGVAITLPKKLRVDTLPDNRRRAAIMWGPLVLAGDLGPEPPRGSGQRGNTSAPTPLPSPVVPSSTAIALVAADRPVTEWLKPVPGETGTFRSQGVGRDPSTNDGPAAANARDVDFVPFYRLHHRTYASYWDLYTPAEYEKYRADIAAERERLRQLEQASIVFVTAGDQQGERAANQQGEESTIVRAEGGRPGRRAGKWFSYDLAVDPAQPLAMVVTYNSDTRRARTFEILVDGQHLADQTIPESSESRYFDVQYRLPADLVRGKSKVTVRFQAPSGNEVSPVFGVRVIREAR